MVEYIKLVEMAKSMSKRPTTKPWMTESIRHHLLDSAADKISNIMQDYIVYLQAVKQAKKTETSKKWEKYISDRMKQKEINRLLYDITTSRAGKQIDQSKSKHVQSHHVDR